jgi:hypothetical protein
MMTDGESSQTIRTVMCPLSQACNQQGIGVDEYVVAFALLMMQTDRKMVGNGEGKTSEDGSCRTCPVAVPTTLLPTTSSVVFLP